MKKLLMIGLLLGSQLGYASIRNSIIRVNENHIAVDCTESTTITCRVSSFVCGCGIAMASVGAVMIGSGIGCMRDNCGDHGSNAALLIFGLPLFGAGSGMIGYALKSRGYEVQQTQRNHRNLDELQAMRIGEEKA